jgi:hypothetical protein
VLARGIEGLNHQRFLEAVLAEFGPDARQQPMLDCAPAARFAPLLQPLGQAGRGTAAAGGAELQQAVAALAQSVQALGSLLPR